MPEKRDLSGIVQPGRGLGTGLIADRGVLEKLQSYPIFKSCPAPSTSACPGRLERGPSWRYLTAAEITPDWEERTGQAGYFGICRGCGALPGARLSGRRAGGAGIHPTRSSCSARRTCARNSASTTATLLRSG